MLSKEIIEKFNFILAEEFEIDGAEISTSSNLMDTLELDSLDLVDVVVLVEKNFGIVLVGTDFVNIKTFEDFYNLIDRKLNESS